MLEMVEKWEPVGKDGKREEKARKGRHGRQIKSDPRATGHRHAGLLGCTPRGPGAGDQAGLCSPMAWALMTALTPEHTALNVSRLCMP